MIALILSGNIPEEIRPVLFGAALTALKKDGGIRPIAVGNTLRRLAGKVVSRKVMAPMGEILRPVQLGFGSRGGAEAAVHATRYFASENSAERVLLKLDFKKAFNTIRWDVLLNAAREYLLYSYPFVWQMYRYSTDLFYGDQVLQSEAGVQQGDPLGLL